MSDPKEAVTEVKVEIQAGSHNKTENVKITDEYMDRLEFVKFQKITREAVELFCKQNNMSMVSKYKTRMTLPDGHYLEVGKQ